MNKKKVISFKDVSFYYENKMIFENISFDVFENEYIVIIGNNGSGKSTLGKLMSLLLKSSSGEIYIDEILVDKDSYKDLFNRISVVFQNPNNQFIADTVEMDIAFSLENKNINQNKMQPIINNITKFMNIDHLLKKQPFFLSGGEKQKLAISSILAYDPNIIILDEAFSMLDYWNKKNVKDYIFKIKKELNKTIINISHEIEDINEADRIFLITETKDIIILKPNEIENNLKLFKENNIEVPFNYELKSKLNIDNINDNSFDSIIGELCKK